MCEKPEGNGAREALVEIVDEMAFDSQMVFSPTKIADGILLRLAARGYIIKPIQEH